MKTNASGNCALYSYNFGAMPSKFIASPTSCTPATWSFYATLADATTSGTSGSTGPSGGAGNVAFTALNTYYMSPTGSDSNSGRSPATAWATPNHAVNCGDVIIAAAGDYSRTGFGSWGQVSNCPSTSGGLAASPGGIYFAVLLCGGADLEACHSNGVPWEMQASNWAVEGFKVSNPGNDYPYRAFDVWACQRILHHFAFINDVAFNTASGYHTNDCGDTSTNIGVDYFAVVGSIAQNAAQNTANPEAAIDDVNPGNSDTNAGTHAIFYGDFSWNNTAASQTPYDTEAMMFDTWAQRPYVGTGVMVNNMAWRSWRYCMQATGTATGTGVIWKWYNNTCYGNVQSTATECCDAEINVSIGGSWPFTIANNIAQTTSATSPHGGNWIGAYFSSWGGLASGTKIYGNVLTGVGGNNYNTVNGNTLSPGPNVIGVDPGFTNTADLLANHMGAPNCTGFTNVTQCMGYNANTNAKTSPSVISDLTANPNCGGVTNQCAGKGYQLPSTTCLTPGTGIVADYPTWLKGIVYLHWDGSQLWENADLVTKPCGM